MLASCPGRQPLAMRVMTPRWPTASADEKTPMDCQSWNSLQPVLCLCRSARREDLCGLHEPSAAAAPPDGVAQHLGRHRRDPPVEEPPPKIKDAASRREDDVVRLVDGLRDLGREPRGGCLGRFGLARGGCFGRCRLPRDFRFPRGGGLARGGFCRPRGRGFGLAPLGRRGLGRQRFGGCPRRARRLALGRRRPRDGDRVDERRGRRAARRRRRRVPRVAQRRQVRGGAAQRVRPRDLVVLLRRVVVREQGRREEQRAHDGEGAGEEAAAWFVLPHFCFLRFFGVIFRWVIAPAAQIGRTAAAAAMQKCLTHGFLAGCPATSWPLWTARVALVCVCFVMTTADQSGLMSSIPLEANSP